VNATTISELTSNLRCKVNSNAQAAFLIEQKLVTRSNSRQLTTLILTVGGHFVRSNVCYACSTQLSALTSTLMVGDVEDVLRAVR